MTNKIAIIGDIHGKLDLIHKTIKDAEDVNIFFQVGDFADLLAESKPYGAPFGIKYEKKLYFIAGNHETWDLLEEHESKKHSDDGYKIRYEDTFVENLHYIPRGDYIDIPTYKIRVAGLGGNYAPSRFRYKRSELHHTRRRHFVADDFLKCCNVVGANILLTHEAPTPFLAITDSKKALKGEEDMGIKVITTLLRKLKPLYHFFGHHHIATERTFYWKESKTKSIGLPMAYIGYVVLDTKNWTHEWRWICAEEKRKVNTLFMERL